MPESSKEQALIAIWARHGTAPRERKLRAGTLPLLAKLQHSVAFGVKIPTTHDAAALPAWHHSMRLGFRCTVLSWRLVSGLRLPALLSMPNCQACAGNGSTAHGTLPGAMQTISMLDCGGSSGTSV